MKYLILLVVFSFLNVNAQSNEEKIFTDEIAAYGLQFKMPPGYKSTKVKKNPNLQYSFAIVNADQTMEVRYSIFPLAKMVAEYEKSKSDPNVVMVNPNNLYTSTMVTNGLNMTGGKKMVDIVDFPKEAVRKEFNADYGGVALVEFDCEFGKGYKIGQFVLLHKDNVADVLITFMSNDQSTHSDLMDIAFHALTF